MLLVATDLKPARGIDIERVSHVIQCKFHELDFFIHRVGHWDVMDWMGLP